MKINKLLLASLFAISIVSFTGSIYANTNERKVLTCIATMEELLEHGEELPTEYLQLVKEALFATIVINNEYFQNVNLDYYSTVRKAANNQSVQKLSSIFEKCVIGNK